MVTHVFLFSRSVPAVDYNIVFKYLVNIACWYYLMLVGYYLITLFFIIFEYI